MRIDARFLFTTSKPTRIAPKAVNEVSFAQELPEPLLRAMLRSLRVSIALNRSGAACLGGLV